MRGINLLPILLVNGKATTAVHSRFRHSKDRQRLRILLDDIILYIVFSSMISYFLMYQPMIQSQPKNIVQVRIDTYFDKGVGRDKLPQYKEVFHFCR
jgi:hypothetical protein